MPRANKGQQKVPILKKTTGLCPSRSYYLMAQPLQTSLNHQKSSGSAASCANHWPPAAHGFPCCGWLCGNPTTTTAQQQQQQQHRWLAHPNQPHNPWYSPFQVILPGQSVFKISGKKKIKFVHRKNVLPLCLRLIIFFFLGGGFDFCVSFKFVCQHVGSRVRPWIGYRLELTWPLPSFPSALLWLSCCWLFNDISDCPVVGPLGTTRTPFNPPQTVQLLFL